MKKYSADILAIALAARILDSDPKALVPYSVGSENADELASFIKQLSCRLQDDIEDSITDRAVSFLIKN
ncbi:hypothetical protein [Laribacter hongkongensis]|uniref:hypothetical protein n=1 Tax=Laribacter hongkongensis TaxID=168471 RepID=UPI001EFC3467|nr:hypothetical protein [Laribacter hongkongensis]MCG9094438.1 hypothetical protein [Laribacter hongkongensis]